ncbi:hypothetical protein AAMO2058_000405600 [Amorphochlora amoebiformis]
MSDDLLTRLSLPDRSRETEIDDPWWCDNWTPHPALGSNRPGSRPAVPLSLRNLSAHRVASVRSPSRANAGRSRVKPSGHLGFFSWNDMNTSSSNSTSAE